MAKGNGESQGSNEMAFVAGFAVAGLAAWLVWIKFRHFIVYILFGMDWLQYSALHHLGLLGSNAGEAYYAAVTNWLTGAVDPVSGDVYDPKTITWPVLNAAQHDIGVRVRWIFTPIIGAMMVYVAFRMKGDGYRRKFTMSGREMSRVFYFMGIKIGMVWLRFIIRSLTAITFTKGMLVREKTAWVSNGTSFMHYQSEHWRVAKAGAYFDPDAEDRNQAPSKPPAEWLRDNGVRLTKREGLDEEAAEAAFTKQLGTPWQGIAQAATHVQAMCLLAGLNLQRDKRVGEFRDRLTEIYILGSSPEREARALLAPFLANKSLCDSIDRRCSKHAFTNTAVIGIVAFCGPFQDWGGGAAGVLAPAMYRWLKKVDRTLWYCLQSIGRRAYYIEGAGATSHFFAERVVGGPLAEAHMDGAVEGLVHYVDDHGILDLDEVFREKRVF